mmetsp:Transcript_5368/g.15349  ORF Transcript_5368/g.15349 Transcript_5368/m.15349 type:complete len:294 (-) Transcript_5368:751-1632(-)
MHERSFALQTLDAYDTRDFGHTANTTQEVTFFQVADLNTFTTRQGHWGTAIDATTTGIVVGRHGAGHRRSTHRTMHRPTGWCCWNGRWQGIEDFVSLFLYLFEEASTINLHAWILEIVAHLQLVCKGERRNEVPAPLLVRLRLRQGFRGLPFDILTQRLHSFFLFCKRRIEHRCKSTDSILGNRNICNIGARETDDVCKKFHKLTSEFLRFHLHEIVFDVSICNLAADIGCAGKHVLQFSGEVRRRLRSLQHNNNVCLLTIAQAVKFHQHLLPIRFSPQTTFHMQSCAAPHTY